MCIRDSINVELRRSFDLFACVRPCKTIGGVKGREHSVDVVVIRENTEDLYAGIEFKEGEEATAQLRALVKELLGKGIGDDSGVSIKPVSRHASERIARFAFRYAEDHHRKKVTVVTKSNIMKFTDGLFDEEVEKVAREYPLIACERLLVDNACFQLVSAPEQFDILLTTNLYGDIISDIGAALVGGMGMVPSANLGEGYALFEAVHGSAPQFTGKGVLNPSALILSGAMMLEYLGERDAALRLESAVEKTVEEGRFVTRDLNRRQYVGTKEMADRIIHFLEKGGYHERR